MPLISLRKIQFDAGTRIRRHVRAERHDGRVLRAPV